MWKLGNSEQVQKLMANRKLLIADGHHRYETAMAFRNMNAPGLKILATHRLVSGVDTANFVETASREFEVREIASLDELKRAWESDGDRSIIGAAIGDR